MIEVGQVLWSWTVINLLTKARALCRCICGKEQSLYFSQLLSGKKQSCGCITIATRNATMLLRHGVTNASQSTVFKNKKKITTLNHYGTENPSQSAEVKQRKKATSIKNYGVEYPMQDISVRTTAKKTCLDKYGFENASQINQFQLKKQETCLENYGTTHPLQAPIVQARRRNTITSRDQLLLLSDNTPLVDYCKRFNISTSWAYTLFHMYSEEQFRHYCETHKQACTSAEYTFIELMQSTFPELAHYNRIPQECKISYRPDFRIEYNNKVLYVNVDGLYWHSIGRKRDGDDKFPNNYHLMQGRCFTDNKLTLFQFREDELQKKPAIVKSIVCNYVGIVENKYNARSTIVKKLSRSTASQFFETNHLMGDHKTSRCYGLYAKDTDRLVCAMSIQIRKDHMEIIRFASVLNSSVRGGFSKLLKYVESIYNPTQVVSFCDLRYATGQSYQKLGFVLQSTTQGWQWTDFTNTFHRLKCRANMDARQLSQKEHAKELKWHKIYDAGQAKYVKLR